MPLHLDKLREIVAKSLEIQQNPGMVVGLSHKGSRSILSFGTSSRDDSSPLSETSIFHLASITKTLVAIAAMQLSDEGQLDLDMPVMRYVPYFGPRDRRADRITVRQLLQHTSGLPDFDAHHCWDRPEYDDRALERYVRSLSEVALLAKPGEAFSYSNMGYEVLGEIVSRVAEKPLEEYIESTIFRPLQMKSSSLLARSWSELVRGNVVDARGEVVPSDLVPYNRSHVASGTWTSSVSDLLTYGEALLVGGEFLRPDTRTKMWTPSVSSGRDDGSQMALGWFVRDHRGERVVGHGGADIGFRAALSLMPEREIIVVVVSNFHWACVREVSNATLDSALGLDVAAIFGDRERWKTLAGRYRDPSGTTVEILCVDDVVSLRHGSGLSRLTPVSPDLFAGEWTKITPILRANWQTHEHVVEIGVARYSRVPS